MPISNADRATILTAAKDQSHQLGKSALNRFYIGACGDCLIEEAEKAQLIITTLEDPKLTEFVTEDDIDRMYYRLICLMDMTINLSDTTIAP